VILASDWPPKNCAHDSHMTPSLLEQPPQTKTPTGKRVESYHRQSWWRCQV